MTAYGFTGTSDGLTDAQMRELRIFFQLRRGSLHEGDCIEADHFAAAVAKQHGWRVVSHPPDNDSKRAFFRLFDEERPPRPYLVRNRNIVNETSVLLAAPRGREQTRSGTWATIRYARKLGRPIVIFQPDGQLTFERCA